MKKFLGLLAGFFCFTAVSFAESVTKEYEIDNLYSMELTVDTDKKTLTANLFSVNTDVFDEAYAEECFSSEVEEISNEYGFSDYEMLSTKKVENYKGKYTMLSRDYKLN